MRGIYLAAVLGTAFCQGVEPLNTEGTVRLEVAERPLALGAVAVSSGNLDFTQWNDGQIRGAYRLLQVMTTLWRDSGFADDYLLQGRCGSEPFVWQMAPYPNDAWLSTVKLVKVIWNVAFGAPHLSVSEREGFERHYREQLTISYPLHLKDRSNDKRNDAFCNPSIIERQKIYSGQLVTVLQDYAPNRGADDQLHMLVIPKACRKEFAELSEDEFVEIQQVTQQLLASVREKGYNVVYLFSNNGINSGQSVPHFHQHLVCIRDEPEGIWNRLTRFFTYLVPNNRIERNELEKLVRERKRLIGVRSEQE